MAKTGAFTSPKEPGNDTGIRNEKRRQGAIEWEHRCAGGITAEEVLHWHGMMYFQDPDVIPGSRITVARKTRISI